MRTFYQLFSAALLCGAALPVQGAGLPGAETVTPAQIATADRPAASREQAQTPSPAEQDVAEAIAAQTAAPQTAAPVTSVPALSGAQVAFAPTDGARFERLLTSQSSGTVNGNALNIRETRTQMDERWEKSGEQWLLHCTPVDASVDDSANLFAKTQELLLSQPYTVVFDSAGKVVEVRGFDDIAEKVKQALPQGTPEHFTAMFTTESVRASVARSQNYQFNWLFGKLWQVGERHTEEQTLVGQSGGQIQINKVATVSAIDATVLILSFEAEGRTPAEAFSEKGTVTLGTSSGQLQQLQRTRMIELNLTDEAGNPVAHKNTEVISITWKKAN